MEINHTNIFYVRNIHEIGGVETFVYELAKKYKDYDIAVVCKTVAPLQKKRLKNFCKVYVHTNQKINCKVIITNWDTSIVDFVNKDAKVYTVLHTDYSNPTEKLGLPKDKPNITYIGITEDSKNKFEKVTGIDRTILCRNPLELEEDEDMLVLVSATRMTEIKDNGRHLKLAQALEEKGVKFIWYIFTTPEYNNNPIWKDSNVVYMKNRLDLGWFMKNADWYIQLSSCEGDSYSLKEALYRGTPIVVCELPYFKEIGIKDNENALFYNLDNSNALEIAEKMKKPLKFTFDHVKDGYDALIDTSKKSVYEEEKNMRAKVRCKRGYKDVELGKSVVIGDEWITDKDRADMLEEQGVVDIIDFIKPDIKEEAKPEVKEEKEKEPKKIVKKSKKSIAKDK